MPASLSGIVGLRERRHDTIRAAAELGDDPNPALRASLAEVALAPSSRVWFAVIRCFDRGHRLCKVLAHLDMLVKHMIPRYVVHLDEMALGVANLGDDMALGDGPRLGARADEGRRDCFRRSATKAAHGVQTAHKTAHACGDRQRSSQPPPIAPIFRRSLLRKVVLEGLAVQIRRKKFLRDWR